MNRIGVMCIVLLSAIPSGCRTSVDATGSDPQPQRSQPSMLPTPGSRIVFRSKNGAVISAADLEHAGQTVTWQVVSQQPVPDGARILHEQGRRAGSAGRNGEAIALFTRATALAPEWPYPVYDAAFTHLLGGDDATALQLYRRVLGMAPRGFFTAITAAHYLALEADGVIPHGTYLAYVSLEWVDSPAEKARRVEALTKSVPTFAPAWKERAALLDDSQQKLASIERGLACRPDPETRGFLLINKAVEFARQGRKGEAIAILGELATEPAEPTDVQQIALFVLKVANP